MSYQFSRISTHSIKSSSGSRSVRDVLLEAMRDPAHCPHVTKIREPILLHGMSPEELLVHHDKLITNRKKEIRANNKDLQKGDRLKNIRRDTHTLSSWVVSYPTPTEKMDHVERAIFKQWAQDVRDAVQQDARDRGLSSLSAVIHIDESHPHIHFYAINEGDPRLDSKMGHPGHVAAREATKNGQRATAAYREAMTHWQDKIWLETGAKHGHARLGPRKRRLTRGQWKEEQAATKNIKNTFQKVSKLEKDATATLDEAIAFKAKAETALTQLNSLIGRTIRLCLKWAKVWKILPAPISAEIKGIAEGLSQLDLLPPTLR